MTKTLRPGNALKNSLDDITYQTLRPEQLTQRAELVPILLRALECDDVGAGSSRYTLANVAEVVIGRGDREASRTSVGQAYQLQIRIPDQRVSRDHARIVREGERWVVEDLGSRNGTALFGAPVARTELESGDVIEIGSTLFLFREVQGSILSVFDKEIRPGHAAELATLSPALEEGLVRIRRIAASALSVLLLGETGAGKEVVARAIHEMSRRPGPFVAVNCGAIPGPLMEAQLFGHVKGAFTGAVRDEVGFVRSAHTGTLFLDEIADLPSSSQAALLRVLQSGEVTPVGSTRSIHSDLRILAATHKDVEALIDQGAFRRDLYARLAGFVHTLLPLRDRPEDLGWLVGTLLARHAPGADLKLRKDAARALFSYPFPLNVRELEQCLASALVLADGEPIAWEHLPGALRDIQNETTRPAAPAPETATLSEQDRAVRGELEGALRATNGNVSEAARRLGKARQQIQRWVRRFGIDLSTFR